MMFLMMRIRRSLRLILMHIRRLNWGILRSHWGMHRFCTRYILWRIMIWGRGCVCRLRSWGLVLWLWGVIVLVLFIVVVMGSWWVLVIIVLIVSICSYIHDNLGLLCLLTLNMIWAGDKFALFNLSMISERKRVELLYWVSK